MCVFVCVMMMMVYVRMYVRMFQSVSQYSRGWVVVVVRVSE